MSALGDRMENWHATLASISGSISLALETRRMKKFQLAAWSGALQDVATEMRRFGDEQQKEVHQEDPEGTGGAVPPVRKPEPRAENKPRRAKGRRA